MHILKLNKFMTKICDHTSVGMLVWQKNKLLLIERKKPPFGFAPPAGHVDGDVSFEKAARRELKEEVGLGIKDIRLLAEKRKNNKCRRIGGDWHYWKFYEVETSGEINTSKDEVVKFGWYSKKQIIELAKRTTDFLANKISDDEWRRKPGLEVDFAQWLQELNII